MIIAILTGEVVSYCGFDLFFLMIKNAEHLFMYLLAFAYLWKNAYLDLLPIFKFNCLLVIELCVCACMLSHDQLFATPWIVTHQASLSVGFPRQG